MGIQDKSRPPLFLGQSLSIFGEMFTDFLLGTVLRIKLITKLLLQKMTLFQLTNFNIGETAVIIFSYQTFFNCIFQLGL
jgi:hypothetical protein